MDPTRARAFAEMLHAGEREPDGTPVLDHVRRVAQMVPAEARAVAWLHEALESTGVTEQELLMEDLTGDELRALRLLRRTSDARSDGIYLAHVELIARAAGRSGRLARMVKIADLEDRCLYPRVRRDGWSPPYAGGLELLLDLSECRVTDAPVAGRGRAAPA
jgi:(p)ppGpp synthase/HD superfamily hydrolase